MKVLWLLPLFLLLGCTQQPSRVVEAQRPGEAEGAGAKLTGPANSGAASNQKAWRYVSYYPPPAPNPAKVETIPVVDTATGTVGHEEVPAPAVAQEAAAPVPVTLPQPMVWMEGSDSTLGAHQDAASIIEQAAKAVNKWGWMRWVGILCILAGIAGWLWSVGNQMGYPLVFLGVAGCGVVFVFTSANPAWLLLILLPLGFYAAQAMNLFKPAP